MTEQSSEYPISYPEAETRIVGDRAMRFVMLEPETPEVVKERDGIKSDVTGSRPMVDVASPDTTFKNTHLFSQGRRAGRYVGERKSGY